VVPATFEHVLEIEARGFRPEDERECWLSARDTCAVQCFKALRTPDAETYSIMVDGKAVGMFGAVPLVAVDIPDGWGIIWMLGSAGFAEVREDFLDQCYHWADHLQRYRRTCINMIHCDNDAAVRWAEAMDFDLAGPEPFGEDGEFFWRAVRRLDPI
jgi:hypothetical protein